MFETVNEIVLKVTRDCNLRCQYCYIKDKDHYKDEKMSLATFQKLIDRIVADKQKDKRDFPQQNFQITFHGGEPTLLGVETLTRFADYALSKIPNLELSMQTNLTNIDDQWLAFMKKYNISPGVSIDGFKKQDNKLRLGKEASFHDKLELLKKAGLGYGALMIISDNNVRGFYKNALKILKHSGNQEIKANYAENTYSSEAYSPEPKVDDLYKFVFIPTMRHFFRRNRFIESNIHVFVDKYFMNIFFKKDNEARYPAQTNCLEKFCAGGSSVVEVDADGLACFCGRWSDVNDVNLLGSFVEKNDFFGLQSFRKIFDIQLKKIADIQNKHCDFCYAQDICTYGCVAFSHDKYDGKIKIREDFNCEYVKKIKRFMMKNRYQIIYHYVRSNKWEIINKRGFYYLNIPPSIGDIYKSRELNDSNLQWEYLTPEKIYLKLSKKLARKRVNYK